MRFVWAGASNVGSLAEAANRREWPVDQPDHLAKLDAVHSTSERITAELSASALDVTGGLELHEDLLEKFDRELLLGSQLPDLNDRAAEFMGDAEVDQGSK